MLNVHNGLCHLVEVPTSTLISALWPKQHFSHDIFGHEYRDSQYYRFYNFWVNPKILIYLAHMYNILNSNQLDMELINSNKIHFPLPKRFTTTFSFFHLSISISNLFFKKSNTPSSHLLKSLLLIFNYFL
jgi:hypothetical protein